MGMCYNPVASSRQAAWVARIWETGLLRINVTFHVAHLKVNSNIVTYNSNKQYVVLVEFKVFTYVFHG